MRDTKFNLKKNINNDKNNLIKIQVKKFHLS